MSIAEHTLIRAACEADFGAILEIYNHYVVTSHVTFDIRPLPASERRAWFDSFRPAGPYRLWVAEHADGIQGYACSTRLRPKPAYDVSVETTIYMTSAAQGHGLGRRLYRALLDSLEEAGLHRAFAAIALPNPASIALHERLGFRLVGCLGEVGYKFGRFWDVAWYERSLKTD